MLHLLQNLQKQNIYWQAQFQSNIYKLYIFDVHMLTYFNMRIFFSMLREREIFLNKHSDKQTKNLTVINNK